jgi:hypothetical protein
MTTAEPPPQQFNRRATDRDPNTTPAQQRRRLVRFLASDPVNVRWLAEHNADLLERVARHIALAGYKEAGSKIRAIADAHRSGQTSPF